jgi:hypothetical protein
MSKNGLRKAVAAAAAALAMLAGTGCSSCGKAKAPRGEATFSGPPVEAAEDVFLRGGHNYVNVTYKPEVKMIEEAQVDASLLGIASNGDDFVFKNASPQIQALKGGDILFVKNQLVRKVLAAQNQGHLTVLITDRAKLADVVESGDIQIETGVDFRGSKRSSAVRPFSRSFFDIFGETVYAQTPSDPAPCLAQGNKAAGFLKSMVGAAFADWDPKEWTVTSGDKELDFKLVLAKNVQGFAATVTITGFVTNFDFATNIHSLQGAGAVMKAGVKHMTGSLHFEWEIGKGTPGVWAKEDRIPLPAGLTIDLSPFTYGMPLQLDISAGLLVHPALTGGDELSAGGFTMKWTGGGNFSFERGRSQSGASPGGAPGGAPGNAPGAAPGNAPGGAPGNAPGGAPGNAPGAAPGNAPGGAPGNAPGATPSIPSGVPSGAPGNLPGQVPGGTPSLPNGIADKVAGGLPNGVPGGPPGNVPPGTGSADAELQMGITKDTNLSPVAPNGMVLSVCLPRLELRLKVFGKYAKALCMGATGLDFVATGVRKGLGYLTGANPPVDSTSAAATASNILASKADVFVQFITTEGVTHSPNETLAPCSKQEMKFTVQAGAEAQLMGLTPGAHTTTDLLSKTYTRWDPASDFCKSVGK